jgi:hypothetical protein
MLLQRFPGATPKNIAKFCHEQYLDQLKILLQYPGVDVSIGDFSAMRTCAANGDVAIMQFLLESENMKQINLLPHTILDAAVRTRFDTTVDLVQLLLKSNKIDFSKAQFTLSESNRNPELFKLLLTDGRLPSITISNAIDLFFETKQHHNILSTLRIFIEFGNLSQNQLQKLFKNFLYNLEQTIFLPEGIHQDLIYYFFKFTLS